METVHPAYRRWSREEILQLILLKGGKYRDESYNHSNIEVWKNIKHDFGESDRTVEQMRKKWENMMIRYKSINKRTGLDKNHKPWEYFDDMHRIVSGEELTMHSPFAQVISSSTAELDNSRHEHWTQEQVMALLQLREEYVPLFNDKSTINNILWKRMAEELNIPKTANQIRKKWENLCGKFKIAMSNNQNNSESQSTNRPYFEDIQRILSASASHSKASYRALRPIRISTIAKPTPEQPAETQRELRFRTKTSTPQEPVYAKASTSKAKIAYKKTQKSPQVPKPIQERHTIIRKKKKKSLRSVIQSFITYKKKRDKILFKQTSKLINLLAASIKIEQSQFGEDTSSDECSDSSSGSFDFSL